MECDIAREALSARIDGERESIPAARVDEHLAGCESCRQWQAAAVEQTQLLRRLAGRSQVAAVRSPASAPPERVPAASVPWRRWALGGVGLVQLGLAAAQALGAHLGVPHAAMGGHVLNESTAWSAAIGVAMLGAAVWPVLAGGLAWVLIGFAGVLSVYVVSDAVAGRVTADRILTHLPVLAAAVLAVLVWRRDQPAGPAPEQNALASGDLPGDVSADIVLPHNASRGRRRGHLRPSDGSAA